MKKVVIDCKSISCSFTRTTEENRKTRTNLPCSCLEDNGFSISWAAAAREMLPEILALRERVKELETQNDKLKEFVTNHTID